MSLFPRCCVWLFFLSFWSGAFFFGARLRRLPPCQLSLYEVSTTVSARHQNTNGLLCIRRSVLGEESLQSLSEVSPWCSAASRLSVGSTVAPRCTLSIPANGNIFFVSLPTKAVISFSCFPFSCHRLSAPIFCPFLQETNVSLLKISVPNTELNKRLYLTKAFCGKILLLCADCSVKNNQKNWFNFHSLGWKEC